MPRYVMCLLVTVLLCVPSAASAVTTTAVTAPADGSHLLIAQDNPGPIHFAGTADAGTPAVDLYCISSTAGFVTVQADLLKSNVDSSSGSFATDAAWPTNTSVCEVFAVAHGASVTTNSDLNGLSGSKIYAATKLTSTYSGKQFDFSHWVASGP